MPSLTIELLFPLNIIHRHKSERGNINANSHPRHYSKLRSENYKSSTQRKRPCRDIQARYSQFTISLSLSNGPIKFNVLLLIEPAFCMKACAVWKIYLRWKIRWESWMRSWDAFWSVVSYANKGCRPTNKSNRKNIFI